MIVIAGQGQARIDEIDKSAPETRGDSSLVRLAALAIRRSLEDAGFVGFPVDANLDPGIACLVPAGEDGVLRWAADAKRGRVRASPKAFGALVHNAAAGRAAIDFGLVGPQVVLVNGDLLQTALLQLQIGRAKLMVACSACILHSTSESTLQPALRPIQMDGVACSIVLERLERTTNPKCRLAAHRSPARIEQIQRGNPADSCVDRFWQEWCSARDLLRQSHDLT